MKFRQILFTTSLFALFSASVYGQTLNWGAPVGESLTDSMGNSIDDSFVFELGAFEANFDPGQNTPDSWLANWRVFDQMTYNQDFGFSTSTVYINNDVTSSNPNASTMSFAGLNAFIWIRKGDTPVPGSEWLLTRAGTNPNSWTFPTVGGSCCDTNVIEWSVSDLGTNDVPEWGRQNDVVGPGVFSPPGGGSGLQTHTFVPEPGSALLLACSVMAVGLRRLRNSR